MEPFAPDFIDRVVQRFVAAVCEHSAHLDALLKKRDDANRAGDRNTYQSAHRAIASVSFGQKNPRREMAEAHRMYAQTVEQKGHIAAEGLEALLQIYLASEKVNAVQKFHADRKGSAAKAAASHSDEISAAVTDDPFKPLTKAERAFVEGLLRDKKRDRLHASPTSMWRRLWAAGMVDLKLPSISPDEETAVLTSAAVRRVAAVAALVSLERAAGRRLEVSNELAMALMAGTDEKLVAAHAALLDKGRRRESLELICNALGLKASELAEAGRIYDELVGLPLEMLSVDHETADVRGELNAGAAEPEESSTWSALCDDDHENSDRSSVTEEPVEVTIDFGDEDPPAVAEEKTDDAMRSSYAGTPDVTPGDEDVTIVQAELLPAPRETAMLATPPGTTDSGFSQLLNLFED